MNFSASARHSSGSKVFSYLFLYILFLLIPAAAPCDEYRNSWVKNFVYFSAVRVSLVGLSPGAKKTLEAEKFIPTLGLNNNEMVPPSCCLFYCKSVRPEREIQCIESERGSGSLSRLGDLMSCRKGRLIRFIWKAIFLFFLGDQRGYSLRCCSARFIMRLF